MRQSRHFLLPLLLLVACAAPPEEPTTITNNGTEIAYSSAGDGTPALVFGHGWTLDRSYWDEQLRRFSSDHRVLAIDLAGHGDSGSGREDWSMEAFGGDVAAVVDGLGIPRVILVGHSMGGSVVLEAAQRIGASRVAGIVLVDTFHDPDQPMSEEEIEGILAAYRDDFRTNVGSMVREYLFAPETDSILADRIAMQMSSFDPAIGVASVEDLFRSDYREVLAGIRSPVVAINSDQYPTNLESMTRYGVAVRTVSGVGHFPMIEDPDQFNQVLAETIENWR